MAFINGKEILFSPIISASSGTDSALPVEIATEEEMMRVRETLEVGQIVKYTGETGVYENGAIYIVEEVSE